MSIPTSPPNRIIAGDSFEFQITIPSDYAGWDGSARMTGADAIDGAVVINGPTATISFAAQDTDVGAGVYTISVWMSTDAKRRTIAQYPITIGANLAKIEADESLSHAAKVLKVIESAILARLSGNPDGGVESYAVEGTTVQKTSLAGLYTLRKKYSAEVARENNPNRAIPRINFRMSRL